MCCSRCTYLSYLPSPDLINRLLVHQLPIEGVDEEMCARPKEKLISESPLDVFNLRRIFDINFSLIFSIIYEIHALSIHEESRENRKKANTDECGNNAD